MNWGKDIVEPYAHAASAPHNDARRGELLEAAIAVGVQEGHAAITCAKVAHAAQCDPEEVQRYFGSDPGLRRAMAGYLVERKARYLFGAIDAAPMVMTSQDRLIALADSYFSYFQETPEYYHYLFEVHDGIGEEEIQQAFQGEVKENPTLNSVIESISQFAHECTEGLDVEVDPRAVAIEAITAWATVHGMGHLSVIGVLRLQHVVVRNYNFTSIIEALLQGMTHRFSAGEVIPSNPLFAQLRPGIEQYVQAKRAGLPQTLDETSSDTDVRALVMEAALDVYGTMGLEAVSIKDLAATLGLSDARVAQVIDNEFILREEAEAFTDAEVAEHALVTISQLGPEASSLDRLRAMAVSYFYDPVADPTRYNAMIALGSRSVVPGNEEREKLTMGSGFRTLLELCRAALIEMGKQPSDHEVYIKTLTLWSGANGIAHLCSLGDFRDFELETKWKIFDRTIESVLSTFARNLPI